MVAGAQKRPGAIIPSADPWLNLASELPQAVSQLLIQPQLYEFY